MSDRIEITIDGRIVEAAAGETILAAAARAGIRIPTLCHDPRLQPIASCRVCLVELEGARKPQPACATRVAPGMVVRTSTDRILGLRRTMLELILSDHEGDCLTCERGGECALAELAYEYGVDRERFAGRRARVGEPGGEPFIARDAAKCIVCGRCARICAEVQGRDVYDYAGRGLATAITTAFDLPLSQAGCEFCGQCVSTCPTGALTTLHERGAGRGRQLERTETTCGFCGCGCRLEVRSRDGRVVDVVGADGPANHGNTCAKGRFGWSFVNAPDRLTRPLVRVDGELRPATWEDALGVVAQHFAFARDTYGPDSFAMLASAKCTAEEAYALQKFARTVIGTNNVDHCARLCHGTTVAGLAIAFGSGAMTNTIDDLADADTIFVVGSNTTTAHPIVALAIKKAVRRGATLVVADPRAIPLADIASLHLQPRPGTNVALFSAMLAVIADEGLVDDAFVEARTEGFDAALAAAREWTPERAEAVTGVPAEDIRRAARSYASVERAAIVYAMGVTQHATGTDAVLGLANLALATGNLGRPGTGVNPLRGQNDVQGASDMACVPNQLPGYVSVADDDGRARFEHAWGCVLPAAPGLTVTEVFGAMLDRRVRAAWIVGENPALSDPDQAHVLEALDGVDFLVVSDLFLTETAEKADVVLPVAAYLEKDGTFVNTERRIQRVRRAVRPPGEAETDLEVVTTLAALMGRPIGCETPERTMAEVASLVPQYAGVTYARLDGLGSLQWPVPDAEHPGTPILHVADFPLGRGRFHPVEYREAPDAVDDEFPLLLTTGRVLHQYHTGTMTRRVPGLEALSDVAAIEVAPVDAERLGIADGERVRVRSRRGDISAVARFAPGLAPGTAFMAFHWAESPANRLTSAEELDIIAKMPPLKTTAIDLQPERRTS